MLKKLLSCTLALFCLISTALPLQGQAMNEAAVAQQNLTGKTLEKLMSASLMIFAREHYAGGKFDADRCAKAFEFYLKHLDYARVFILESETTLFDFKSPVVVSAIAAGDSTIPAFYHNLVVNRYKEYLAFAKELLEKPQDSLINSDEEVEVDRKDAPRPQSVEEMKNLWRQRIVNSLIIELLSDRSANEKYAAAQAKKAKGEWKKDEEFPTLPTRTPKERIVRRIEQTLRFMQERDKVEIVEFFLNAVATTYDPHTCYFAPVTDEDFNIGMTLKLIGIGATLSQDDGYTKIVDLVPGGPADLSGKLGVGDRIIEVAQDGKPAEDIVGMPLTKVVQRIRGPLDTKVTLTVLKAKDGLNGVPEKLTIVRKEIQVKDSHASGHIYEIPNAKGVKRRLGVIYMPSFYMDIEALRANDPNGALLSRDVAKILTDFMQQGVDGIVCDMRGNGGGSLPDCIEATALFLGENAPVVQVSENSDTLFGRVHKDETYGSQKTKQIYDGPLVILQDRNSASASEIFAAALQDSGRAVIVGDSTSHGKGSVQTMVDLQRIMELLTQKKMNAGTIKVTIAKFYRINGGTTQLRGVSSDIVLPSLHSVMELGEDKLDNPLPYDTIEAAKYMKSPCADAIAKKMPTLKANSAERVKNNKDFIALQKFIALYKDYRDKKTISLNLQKRIEEDDVMKKVNEEIIKIMETDINGRKKNKDKNKRNNSLEGDAALQEALNVLNDLID